MRGRRLRPVIESVTSMEPDNGTTTAPPGPRLLPTAVGSGWPVVELVMPDGYRAGIAYNDAGKLVLAVRPPGGDWPAGVTVDPVTVHTVGFGRPAYRAARG